jgi:hypothetical protein
MTFTMYLNGPSFDLATDITSMKDRLSSLVLNIEKRSPG